MSYRRIDKIFKKKERHGQRKPKNCYDSDNATQFLIKYFIPRSVHEWCSLSILSLVVCKFFDCKSVMIKRRLLLQLLLLMISQAENQR